MVFSPRAVFCLYRKRQTAGSHLELIQTLGRGLPPAIGVERNGPGMSSNVQLTRVHYYDEATSRGNVEIPTVSRQVHRNIADEGVVIKRNVFGHKWVLRINPPDEPRKKKCSAKVLVYLWVLCCIVTAVCFGLYFTIGKRRLGEL